MLKFRSLAARLIRQIRMSSSHARYFPNTKPECPPDLGKSEIPIVDLKNHLNKILVKIERNIEPIEENAGNGIYLGTAGIAYMYYHLSKIPTLSDMRSEFLKKAMTYLKPALVIAACSTKQKQDIPSFILGNCGIYAVAAAIFKAVGDDSQFNHFRKMYLEAADICKEPAFLKCGSDELFVGRAGYILGALWLSYETVTPIQKSDIYLLCKTIVDSGRQYARRHRLPCPLQYAYYKVEYLGAAHGLCSILQVLLSVPGYLDSQPSDAADIKQSIDYLLSLQDKEGNFPTASDEIGYRSELVHWCHGAGGTIYLMAKAYLTFKEDKYLQSCIKMGDLIWRKGLLRKGPGICHGVAGNGYAFLLLFRLTNDEKHLYRAIEFFRFMETEEFQKNARCPDYPYSLYEGLAGTACYVGDLTCPSQAKFPFSDVLV